jgi:KaiC/GvpD/RAD55 family RecA-like ATPase
MKDTFHSSRFSTETPSFDDNFPRGLSGNETYLLESDCGTHKTLATQFILEGKRQDEFCLSVTLSESNSLT